MSIYKFTQLTVPPTLEKQLEVLEAIRSLATQEEEAARSVILKASADDPKHPGWPAGAAGGRSGKFRPTDGGGQSSPDSTDAAHNGQELDVAVVSGTYQKCLDLCYPLLERFQPAGSDRNTWDFHKCMNACLGR